MSKTITIIRKEASPWFYPGLIAICLGGTSLFYATGEQHFFLVFSTGIAGSLFWAYFSKGDTITFEVPDHIDPSDIEIVDSE